MLAAVFTLTLLAPSADDVVYTSERAFRIPLEIGDAERKQAAAVRLMVSTDQGKTWNRVREESPRRPTITFRAPTDGLYWLALAVIGHDERMRPANPADLKPGLKVYVDSQRPDVALEAVRTRSGLRGVRWTATDSSPEAQLKMQAAVWDRESNRWKPRSLADCKNKTLWFDRNESIGKMQLWAVDPAGNETVTQISIDGDRFLCSDEKSFVFSNRAPTPEEFLAAHRTPEVESRERDEPNLLLAQGDAEPLAPKGEKPTKPARSKKPVEPPAEEHGDEEPAPKPSPKAPKSQRQIPESDVGDVPTDDESQPMKAVRKEAPTEEAEANDEEPKRRTEKPKAPKSRKLEADDDADAPEPMPTKARKPAPASTKRKPASIDDPAEPETERGTPARAEGSDAEVTYTNRKTVLLHYETDAEPTDFVTLWGTMDDGKTWKLLGRDSDETSPLEATFPRAGRWGIRLEIPTKNGDGRPQPGDPPNSFVEVDARKPVVTLEQPSYERDWVRVAWSAEDANLAEDSVRVAFSLRPDGPWKTIVAQQPTVGEYIWKPSDEAAAVPVYLKIDALDKAGNIGSAVARKAIQREPAATATKSAKLPVSAEPETEAAAPSKTKSPAKRPSRRPTEEEESDRPAPRPTAKAKSKSAVKDSEELLLPDDR